MDEHIVAATITALKRLEGSLILYVHKLNCRNVDAATTLSQIKGMFREVKMTTKIVKITHPRYMLLKAYYYMIKFQRNAAMKLLKRLKKVCLKVENTMIYAWALHFEKVWSGGLTQVERDRWKEVSEENLNEWSEINANEPSMVIFTFPLPIHPY